MSVENFLYTLNKIAKLESVPERLLLKDIHLLLKGLASDWIFMDQFEDRSSFERFIKFRFGNHNQNRQ